MGTEYERGKQDGRNSGALEQTFHDLADIIPLPGTGEYDAGYHRGVEEQSSGGDNSDSTESSSSESSSSESSSSENGDSSSGCFISTACVVARGLPDDCL